MNQDIDTAIELEGLVQEYLQDDDFEIREGIAGAIRNQLEEWDYFQQDFIEYCTATLDFMDAVADLSGPAGAAVRFEITQSLLTAQ